MRRRADADPARLGQCLQARSDVDAIAKDIAVFDNDVADIDAHAEFDPASGWHGGIAGDHFALHLDGAAHGVNDTGELDQKPVTGCLHDAATVFLYLWVAEFPTD